MDTSEVTFSLHVSKVDWDVDWVCARSAFCFKEAFDGPRGENKEMRVYICMSSPTASWPTSQNPTDSASRIDNEYVEHGNTIDREFSKFWIIMLLHNKSVNRTIAGTSYQSIS
jgi:hypothetical protein